MKRVVTLDILRGIAIFVVIISHVFIYVVDDSMLDPGTGSILFLIIISPLIFLGKWKGFFLMVSAATEVFTMHNGLKKKTNPLMILLKQVINAILLLGVAYLFKIFLLPGAVLYQYIFNGIWDPSSRIQALQFSDTLESIAFSRIIIAILYFTLTRGKGLEKPARNIMIKIAISEKRLRQSSHQ